MLPTSVEIKVVVVFFKDDKYENYSSLGFYITKILCIIFVSGDRTPDFSVLHCKKLYQSNIFCVTLT